MDETAPVTVERRPPEETFGLLANETRMAILQALGDAPTEPMTFSDLRERVGAPDSGKFNYHLRKLLDHFVRRTDAGYELTLAGQQIVGALVAGTYTTSVAFEPIEVDDPCPRCGGALVADYENEHVQIRCPDCDDYRNQFPFPPGTLEQFDRDELPAAFDRWLGVLFDRAARGFCPNCAGRLSSRLEPTDTPEKPVRLHHRCQRCGDVTDISPVSLLAVHPAGIAFYHDHGIDVTTTPTWVIARQVEQSVTLLDRDPPEARVALDADDERLVAVVDATGQLSDVRREPID